MAKAQYDCTNCLAFCCTIYERVGTEEHDIQRLADHFGVSFKTAKRKYTEIRHGDRVLKRQPDPLLGETCKFLDLDTRMCTIYDARPDTCREYPPTKKCVYYDVLQFEREHQGTNDVVINFELSVPVDE